MATLKDLLIRRYGYGKGDFGTAGLVRVDCGEGTISPVPLQDIFTPQGPHPEKVVRLASLFQANQRVVVKGVGREKPVNFRILLVSGDGLMVQLPAAGRRFLPWSALRHGLLRPDLIVFPEETAARQPPAKMEKSSAQNPAKSLCTPPRLAL